MARGADQHQNPQSDIEIAQAATMRPIGEIAGKLGIPDDAVSPYGRYKAKIGSRLHRDAEGPAERQADPRHRDHADPGRRGQDDDDGRPRRRAESYRQEGDHLPARAEPRPELRHEGRRRRRRLCPGRADGGHQPPFHRRFPRDRRREQSARRDGRQPHLLGQRTRHRLAPRHLAPRPRHERPRAALDRLVARRGRQRLPARGRVRHHRRLRGHGDLLPRQRSRRPEAASRQHHRRPDPRARAGARQPAEGGRARWRCC